MKDTRRGRSSLLSLRKLSDNKEKNLSSNEESFLQSNNEEIPNSLNEENILKKEETNNSLMDLKKSLPEEKEETKTLTDNDSNIPSLKEVTAYIGENSIRIYPEQFISHFKKLDKTELDKITDWKQYLQYCEKTLLEWEAIKESNWLDEIMNINMIDP